VNARSVCVVTQNGKILSEAKVPASRGTDRLVQFVRCSTLNGSGWKPAPCRNGFCGVTGGAEVELLETRHVRKAFEAPMPSEADATMLAGLRN